MELQQSAVRRLSCRRVPDRRWSWALRAVPAALLLVLPLASGAWVQAGEKNELAAARLLETARVLAADAMEGRGAGTQGLDAAAQYIADQFGGVGLRTDVCDGAAFQVFRVPGPPELGPPEENRLVLRGPSEDGTLHDIDCVAGQDFKTLAIGGSGTASGPLVFVGYGITAPDWNYDDYAGLDVRGRIVLMLRKEPQQGDAASVFNGLQPSEYASFRQKVENARVHGAAAVVIVADAYDLAQRRAEQHESWRQAVDKLTAAVDEFSRRATWSEETVRQSQTELAALSQMVVRLRQAAEADADELPDFRDAGGPLDGPTIPVFFARRSVWDPLVQRALGTDLESLEQQIDRGPAPQSRALEGWTAECQSSVVAVDQELKNVVGVLDGTGTLADETIVIGAHYDHLGRGPARDQGEIYNGADDNASGVAGIIEIARRLASQDEATRRRLVFVAFSGEELGLLGSAHYVRAPLFPLDTTVAMVNLDMIGRLREGKLTIGGTGSAAEFDALLDEFNTTYQFTLARMPSGRGPSDHASFYGQQVPVLFFYTNDHPDYHRPTDDVEKLNIEGLLRVTDFVTDIVDRLDSIPQRPTYRETAPAQRGGRGPARPYLGCVTDNSGAAEGVTLLRVAPGSPAEQGGLRPDDVLVRFGSTEIRSFGDLDQALRGHRPGEAVAVVVRRQSGEVPLTVVLGAPR